MGKVLRKKLGRTPSGGVSVTERKIGEDLWRFDHLESGGPDVTSAMIVRATANIPWIVEAAALDKPYTLQTMRDNSGTVIKLVYHLYDGRSVELEDTNKNCIVDVITYSGKEGR